MEVEVAHNRGSSKPFQPDIWELRDKDTASSRSVLYHAAGLTHGPVNGWPSMSKLRFAAARSSRGRSSLRDWDWDWGVARLSLGGDACVPIVDGPEKV